MQGEATSLMFGVEDYGKNSSLISTPIYRYMNVDRYFDLVEKGYLSLSHITMWEDPYEGFIFRAAMDAAKSEEEKVRIYDGFKYYYGQSWTIEGKETDEKWRANGPRGTVVRVGTTIEKLCRCLLGGVKQSEGKGLMSNDIKVGMVQYPSTDEEFEQLLQPGKLVESLNGDERERLEMFFIKRHQFKSEAEFRVMVHAIEGGLDRRRDTDGRFLKIDVDPNEIIESVLVDPCMPRDKYEQLICRTRHFCSNIFPKKSHLFEWPRINGGVEISAGLENRFWKMLQAKYPEDALELSRRSPSNRTYWQISFGENSFFFYFNRTNARVEYYIPRCDSEEQRAYYERLKNQKTEIERVAGELIWEELAGESYRKLIKRLDGVSINKIESWGKVCNWLCKEMSILVEAILKVQ